MNNPTSYADPLTAKQEEEVKLPIDPWGDDFAKKIVVRDWTSAENFRAQNHDWRYRSADELYLAWVAQKYWEGTRYPRSSLGVYLAFQQIESLLPNVMSALFGDIYPFDAEPNPGTTIDQARAVRDLQDYQLREAGVREVFRRCFKSAYIYGNGICELGWRYAKVKRVRFLQTFTPIKQVQWHPVMGPMAMPTGQMKRNIQEQEYEDVVNEPYLRYVSIKDFYMDPNCQSPIVQDGRFCIRRSYMFIDELMQLKDEPGFKIPPKNELLDLAKEKPSALADVTKSAGESFRNMWWQPALDSSADPAAKRIEVLEYTTRDRKVWLANREIPIFNRHNPYGMINYFDAFYTDVLDRFYGLAITDVTEGDQRLQQGLLNGRLDEVAMALHPPARKKRGAFGSTSQYRRRPGLVTDTENPKEDYVQDVIPNVTQEAYVEVEASERRSQKTTGLTDLAVLGSPGGMGNSANRSATGIATQSSASGKRIEYLVENTENTFVAPLLKALHELNKKFLDREKVIAVLGQEEGQQIQLDPFDVLSASVKFTFRGAAKIRARSALQQAFPLLMQTLMNPEFLQMLAQQSQMTINIQEIGNIVADMTGYKPKGALFIPLSQQQIQQMNQPSQDAQLKMRMQQERLSSQSDNIETKGMIDAIHAIIKEAAKHAAPQKELAAAE